MRWTAWCCLLALAPAGSAGAAVFRSEPSLAIPDNSAGGVSDTLQAAPSCTIEDVNIAIEVGHVWVGDLIFRVTHNGVTVTIVDRPGYPAGAAGCDGNLNCDSPVVFDDASPTPIEDLCPTVFPAGDYQPNQPLNAFNGGDQMGEWTLFVSDNAPLDPGMLCAWEVRTQCMPGAVEPATWGAIKVRYRE